MAITSKELLNPRAVGRRTALKSVGGVAALVAGVAATAHWKRAFAQSQKTVQVWTPQYSPEQQVAWKFIVGSFEAAHPGIKVAVAPVSSNDIWPKLTAAFGGGQVPDIIDKIVAPTALSLYDQGLLDPVDDVIDAVGRDDFQKNALDIYTDKGHQFACAFGNNSLNLWYRKDLLGEEGLEVPKYWDEFAAMSKALTKNGNFGTALPYGKTHMTNTIMWTFVYQAGGLVIGPDNSVVFNTPETWSALEFLKEMNQYVPPGASRYSWGEVLNAYVTGVSASTMYTGRAIVNVNTQNPSIADAISAAPYPYRREGRPWWTAVFEAITIPKGGKNLAEAKMFAAWCYRPAEYIKFLHSAPGHQIPVLKSIGASDAFLSHPLLQKYKAELATMIEVLGQAHSPSKPTDDSPFITKAGDIQGSGVFAEVIQKVVIGGESAKAAAAWGHDEIARIMKG